MTRGDLGDLVLRGEAALRAMQVGTSNDRVLAAIDTVRAAMRALNMEQARLYMLLERTTIEVLDLEKRMQNGTHAKRGRRPLPGAR